MEHIEHSVPHLPHESAEWGIVKMRPAMADEESNIVAATGFREGGEKIYLEALYSLFL